MHQKEYWKSSTIRVKNRLRVIPTSGTHNKPMNAARPQYLFLVLVTFWLGATPVHAADAASPIGLWRGADATFEMSESEGKLSAKIVGLSEPKTTDGKEKSDIFNPDPRKRNHPIIGLVFISGLTKKSATRWENGTVYDPTCGKTYSCFIELQGPDQIMLRGFIGDAAIGRNYIWTRVN
jgi:uncharacterized protein (DUF2147 family)